MKSRGRSPLAARRDANSSGGSRDYSSPAESSMNRLLSSFQTGSDADDGVTGSPSVLPPALSVEDSGGLDGGGVTSGGAGGSLHASPSHHYHQHHNRSGSNVGVGSLSVSGVNTTVSNNNSTLDEDTSNTVWYDELDAANTFIDQEAKQKALDQLQKKINRTRDQIKVEQNSKEANVDEYLRVSSSADKQQLARIKQVFEKKNQKSAQSIAQLQKKLENYQRKVRDIDQHGSIPSTAKQPKEVLKAMGLGIKSVGGGVVGTLTKPKEFAHLIRNKFGSADNIPSNVPGKDDEERRSHHGSASLPREGRQGSVGGSVLSDKAHSSFEDPRHCASDDGHQSVPHSASSITSDSERGVVDQQAQDQMMLSPRHLGLETLMSEINEKREETERLREELEEQRQHFKQELEFLTEQLREERYRYERLEEQINDLTELHQNEIENIKSGITDMEEKVQYQSEERLRDVQDQLANMETKIYRLEHQAAQHQQYVTLEGLENSNFRAVIVKGINVALTFLQVIFLLMETSAQILKPFLKTPTRTVTTCLLVIVTGLAVRQWSEIILMINKLNTKPPTLGDGQREL